MAGNVTPVPASHRYALCGNAGPDQERYPQALPGWIRAAGQGHQARPGDGEVEFVKTSGTSDVSVTNIWNQKWWDESERLPGG